MSATYLNDASGVADNGPSQTSGVIGFATAALTGIVGQLLIWQGRAAERHHLADMDDRSHSPVL